MDDSTQPNMPSEWTEPLDDLTRAIPPHTDFRDELPDTRRTAPNTLQQQTVQAPVVPQMPAPSIPPMYNALPVYVPPPPVQSSGSQWMLLVAIGAVGITLLFGLIAFIGLRVLNARGTIVLDNVLGTTNVPSTQIASAAMPTQMLPTLAVPTPEVSPTSIGVQIQPWNGTERFTVLLLGLDKRPSETGTAFRTDAMMLVSFDPKTNSVGILSIPRDLYVEVPADTVTGRYYGLQKVNSAYVLGELARPGYGAELAMQTVQYNLGIRVHDYVVFEFQTVIDVVNAVGGIDIDVKSPISDAQYPDMYYGYDPLYIPAGRIHMNGELALKYGRSRHGSSDIDRAQRQQEVIMAVRDRILSYNMIPQLLVQAPNLWGSLSRHVKSGLSFEQMVQLLLYAKDIKPENIRRGVIDFKYVQGVMWNGASVLVPNRAAIGPLLVEVFGENYNE